MLNLPDRAAIEAALQQPLDPELHSLLAERLATALDRQLEDLTHILVIEPGDAEADIVDAIGFSPLSPEAPPPDWTEAHASYEERLYCSGNTGFAFIVLLAASHGFRAECEEGCNFSSPPS